MPDAGLVQLFGQRLSRLIPRLKGRVGVLIGAHPLGDDLRILGQLEIWMEFGAGSVLHAMLRPRPATRSKVRRLFRVPVARGKYRPAGLSKGADVAIQPRDYRVALGHAQ
jgi:hypothetical protein